MKQITITDPLPDNWFTTASKAATVAAQTIERVFASHGYAVRVVEIAELHLFDNFTIQSTAQKITRDEATALLDDVERFTGRRAQLGKPAPALTIELATSLQ